jgi:hypothetical protein
MKYKNVSDKELSISGVGSVKPGQEVDMPEGFHNANFEPVKKAGANKPNEEK